MENLNDTEFGSDNKGKEAPILVAQRYLNIFRQVHIFNKAKRDEFDDELLNLEQEIVNLIKRMPGGQLLIKHIEAVKTERGIAFERSNDDGTANSVESEQVAQAHSGGQPIVGGSVVIDASFAETLAKALARAFQQLPTQSLPTANGAIPTNMGNMFEVMAKEIQTTRVSFEDLLKETRSITDSVIASQVSISRVLDSILSSRKRDEIDLTNLNNRIIASQAAITKLLENLHTPQNRSQNSGDFSLDIDDKLQAFKRELHQDIERAVQQALKDYEPVIPTLVQEEDRFAKAPQPVVENNPASEENAHIHFSLVATPNNEDLTTPNPNKKNKKKKKKNKQDGNEASLIVNSNAINSGSSTEHLEGIAPEVFQIAKEANTVLSADEPQEAFHGVIRNNTYPHQDDFNNVDLNNPPLDDISLDNLDTNDEMATVGATINDTATDDDFSGLDELADTGLDFELPQDDVVEEDVSSEAPLEQPVQDDFSGLDELADTGLDFELPQDDVVDEGVSSEAPLEQPVQDDFSALDELADTGLDFELPQEDVVDEDVSPEAPLEQPAQDDFSGLDELANTGLDFELPQEDVVDEGVSSEAPLEQPAQDDFSALDELADTGLDFELPQDDVVDEGVSSEAPLEQPVQDDFSGLDELADTGLDFELPQDDVVDEDVSPEAPLEQPAQDDFSGLDALMSETDSPQNSFSTTPQPTAKTSNNQPSRYSAELDRIRQALTSDNVDISSLDEPIALDDYQDDERLTDDSNNTEDTFASFDSVSDNEHPSSDNNASDVADTNSSDEDWEWEYVDENGNPIEGDGNDEDWEWEYVEDDTTNPQKPDNNL